MLLLVLKGNVAAEIHTEVSINVYFQQGSMIIFSTMSPTRVLASHITFYVLVLVILNFRSLLIVSLLVELPFRKS